MRAFTYPFELGHWIGTEKTVREHMALSKRVAHSNGFDVHFLHTGIVPILRQVRQDY